MKQSILKKCWIAILSAMLLVTLSLALAACGGNKKRINAPARLEEDIGAGTYIVPEYEVVNEIGVIMYGYTVTLKSAVDHNGENCEITRGVGSTTVTLNGSGDYTFVYTTGTKDIEDATVTIDFADRTAPTINYNSGNLPKFFIKGNYYDMPAYTIDGDYDITKCKAEVYYFDAQNQETKVAVDGGRFLVEKGEGKYEIRIHLEDAAGNYNDYKYAREVDGPQTIVENTVLYFNEEFGARQVSALGSGYTGAFVSKTADGAHVYGDEAGAYKVSFNGVETTNNEGYIEMKVPAITNISDYKELEMYVYNDCGADIFMGSRWWNDQSVKKDEWTRLTWSVANWGGAGSNVDSSNVNIRGVGDITGTNIRFIFAYDGKTIPHGDFYLSAMRAVPREKSQVTAGENVLLDKANGNYFFGDTVRLSAKQIEGKVVDCYYINGEPISGEEFVVTQKTYSVTVSYVEGALTKENMTWGTAFNYTDDSNTANEIVPFFAGNGDGVISLDVVGGYKKHEGVNQLFNLSFLLGSTNSIEIQINEAASTPNVCKWYFDGSNWGVKVADLPAELVNKIKEAADEEGKRVHFDAVKKGNRFSIFVDGELLCTTSLKGLNLDGNFGYGWRLEGETPAPVVVENAKAVMGTERLNLFMEDYKATVTVDKATLAGTEYYVGDEVTFTADEAPAGKMFCWFTVNGKKIEGNSFVVTSTDAYTVAAVYADTCTLTLAEGITANGKTGTVVVPQGIAVTLAYTGTVGENEAFDCFTVNGSELDGDSFVPASATYTVAHKTAASAEGMHWDTPDFVQPTGASEVKVTKLGNGDHWALSYQITHVNTNNAGWYTGVYIGGTAQLAAFELASWGKTFNLYGHVYAGTAGNGDLSVTLSQRVIDILNGATASDPVTVIYVRQNNVLRAYISTQTEFVLAAEVPLEKFIADKNYTNAFGYGWRSDFGNPTIENIKFVVGEKKTQFYMQSLKFIQLNDYDEYVTLGSNGEYTLPTAKIVDSEGNETAGTVEVVSVKDALGKSYAVSNGKITVSISGSIALTITYKVQGQNVMSVAAVTVQSNDNVVYAPAADNTALIAGEGNTVGYDTSIKFGGESGSLKVTVGGTDTKDTKVLLGAYDYDRATEYVEFYAYTDKDNVKIGTYWTGDTPLTKNAWTKFVLRLSDIQPIHWRADNRFVVRIMSDSVIAGANVYLSKITCGTFMDLQSSETQISDIQFAKLIGGSADKEYAALPAALSDSNVKETEVLKLSAMQADANGDVTINISSAYISDLTDYENIYFYVYTADSGIQGATYWCANTNCTENAWTKVTVTRNTNWAYHDGAVHHDGVPTGTGNVNPYEGGAGHFIYRLCGVSGKTVYVTSLYGTPKTDA